MQAAFNVTYVNNGVAGKTVVLLVRNEKAVITDHFVPEYLFQL